MKNIKQTLKTWLHPLLISLKFLFFYFLFTIGFVYFLGWDGFRLGLAVGILTVLCTTTRISRKKPITPIPWRREEYSTKMTAHTQGYYLTLYLFHDNTYGYNVQYYGANVDTDFCDSLEEAKEKAEKALLDHYNAIIPMCHEG